MYSVSYRGFLSQTLVYSHIFYPRIEGVRELEDCKSPGVFLFLLLKTMAKKK